MISVGLQSHVRRFDSDPRLQYFSSQGSSCDPPRSIGVASCWEKQSWLWVPGARYCNRHFVVRDTLNPIFGHNDLPNADEAGNLTLANKLSRGDATLVANDAAIYQRSRLDKSLSRISGCCPAVTTLRVDLA